MKWIDKILEWIEFVLEVCTDLDLFCKLLLKFVYAFDSLKLLWRLFKAVSDSATASFSNFACRPSFNFSLLACLFFFAGIKTTD